MKLKKILDFSEDRAVKKLEIVVVSHENYDNIVNNFSHLWGVSWLQIVVLETTMSDKLLVLCKSQKIRLYERLDCTTAGVEKNFVDYFQSESNINRRILFLYSDEFVTLGEITRALQSSAPLIYVQRCEFFYGLDSGLLSKQFRGGAWKETSQIIYGLGTTTGWHNFWCYKNHLGVQSYNLRINHLHHYDVLSDYGKSSRYVYSEISCLRARVGFKFWFIKRFGFRLVRRILNIRLLVDAPWIYLYLIFAQIIESAHAFMFLVEDRLRGDYKNIRYEAEKNGLK